MIHEAILKLYSKACTINGDTKDTISVKDSEGKDVSINWSNVETKAKELEKIFNDEEKNKRNKQNISNYKTKNTWFN